MIPFHIWLLWCQHILMSDYLRWNEGCSFKILSQLVISHVFLQFGDKVVKGCVTGSSQSFLWRRSVTTAVGRQHAKEDLAEVGRTTEEMEWGESNLWVSIYDVLANTSESPPTPPWPPPSLTRAQEQTSASEWRCVEFLPVEVTAHMVTTVSGRHQMCDCKPQTRSVFSSVPFLLLPPH